MNTSELQGAALDWAVAKCEGLDLFETEGWLYEEATGTRKPYRPSTDWAQGGPIIEREGISLRRGFMGNVWTASVWQYDTFIFENGDTALIAAMRCYVASKLGDTVKIPKELK